MGSNPTLSARCGRDCYGLAGLPKELFPDELLLDALPDDALPDDALPDDALPEEAFPDEALPDDALPEEELPEVDPPDVLPVLLLVPPDSISFPRAVIEPEIEDPRTSAAAASRAPMTAIISAYSADAPPRLSRASPDTAAAIRPITPRLFIAPSNSLLDCDDTIVAGWFTVAGP